MVSIATGKRTFVLDCITADARQVVISQVSELLQAKDIIKIFCGSNNDLCRLKQEWECFPVNVIDLQDLFRQWKLQNNQDCYNSCEGKIKAKVFKEKRKRLSDWQANEYFHSYESPSLEFLSSVLLSHPMKKNKIATMADFRKRPLHTDLIEYAGMDAHVTMEVFKLLSMKVNLTKYKLHCILKCTTWS